jgi:2-keto-4-pentenoate hydratase/2-oxohepta-3-ene-1,7-dioic acid hydratase in catechol pathway
VRLVMMQVGKAPAEPGVLLDDGSVARIGVLLPEVALHSIADVLEAWNEIRDRITVGIEALSAGDARQGEDVIVEAGSVRLQAPVGDRALIVCAGGNYRAHNVEMPGGPPRVQSFVKASSAVIGSNDPIRLPKPFPDMVDYEGEICVVFDRECHGVKAEDAMKYVGGYTILNDVSARHGLPALMNAKTHQEDRWAFQEIVMGKHLPTFAPIGPTVVTAEDVPDPTALRLITTLNGEVMQDAVASDLETAIPELIERMSEYYTFRPGDVLSTGTPGGTGAGQSPPRYLRDGDNVSIEVQPIGVLSNDVRAATS